MQIVRGHDFEGLPICDECYFGVLCDYVDGVRPDAISQVVRMAKRYASDRHAVA